MTLERIIPSSDIDQTIWSYLNLGSWYETIRLLAEPNLLPEYRQRLTEMLLAPEGEGAFLKILEREELAELLSYQPRVSTQVLKDYIKKAEQKVADEKWENAWSVYNCLIIDLLPLLPRQEGEELFSYLRLNDVKSPETMDDSSGYYPLKSLFSSRKIDQYWKEEAAAKMHEIIHNEKAGLTQPRQEYEDALGCYAAILEVMTYYKDGTMPIDKKIFQEEISFLLDFDYSKPIFLPQNIGKAFDLIESREIKLRLARQADPFLREGKKINLGDQVVLAEKIVAEFPGEELAAFYSQKLPSWKKELRQRKERGNKGYFWEEAKEAILTKMTKAPSSS